MGIGRDNSLTRAVFFDRDGVLNAAIVKAGRPFPPAGIDELRIDAAAAPSLATLRERGFSIVVVTNQPDVARGTATREQVEAINERLVAELPIDAVYVCYHDNADACECRKPKPGLLVAAARERDIELARSYMVGDRWSDVAAGRQARCRTVWIERGYDEQEPLNADARVTSLAAACNWILDDCNRS
jgi:D-glycero-D-manno-heptose 1,7-bisphosphate phosphatase